MYLLISNSKELGFPIRISKDQSVLTTPLNFSQPATSFIDS